MNKQQEALKLALEALEYISSHYMSLPKIGCMALAAIEEALAERPAQQHIEHCLWARNGHTPCPHVQPASKPWVGLTDEEVVALKMVGRDLEFVSMTALRRFARDIEATLKEKNT